MIEAVEGAPALVMTDVRKSFVAKRTVLGRPKERVVAVDGVSLTIGNGETLAVVGESGAGKSTVGRIALHLEAPDSGTVSLFGRNTNDMSARELRSFRRHAQMIFQDPYNSLDPRMTIGTAVGEPLQIHEKFSADESEARVIAALTRVGMSADHMSRYPYQFSGGQLQRVAIARALMSEPRLLVCDEPVAALDVSIRAQVLNLLLDLQEALGIAYLFITHDLSLVKFFAPRMMVMKHGRAVEEGLVRDIFEDPSDPYTKALLAAIPMPRSSRASRPKEATVHP